MKKIKFVLKATLFCLAAALSLGLAQAGPYGPWPNDNAPFGTNGNLILNWSFEQPNGIKITTGFDTVTNWFSSNPTPPATPDSGIQGGNPPNVAEDSYDGLWDAWTLATNGFHARQTTGYVIQQGDCFLVSVASKGEWINNINWTKIDGYLSVMLYYGGTATTVGTPFFTNTFVIHPAPGGGSHTEHTDWTNYFCGVITNNVPTNAFGQTIGIDVWQSTTQYNANAVGSMCWLDFDGVVLIPTKGIPPIAAPLVLTPTNSVWGGDTLTFTENAFGSTPMAYRWQTDGGSGGTLTNIDGAVTNYLEVVTSTNAGTYSYQVIITNSYGSATSAVVSYVVLGMQAPFITQNTGTADFGSNTDIYAFIGGKVNFYAAFAGAPVVTNQWRFGTNSLYITNSIVGATNYLRILTNVQSSSVGYYMFVATNAFGSSNTTPAHLTALADPAAPAVTDNGANLSYSYCVYTNHPWAYWRFEETNNTLTSSMQAYDYSGHNYDATYGNGDGTAGSGCKDGGESVLQSQYGPIPSGGYSGFTSTNGCASLSYNHNNGCLRVPPLNLNTNTVTFTMWIYPKAAGLHVSTGLFMNRNGSDGAGIGFGTVTNGAQTPCLSYTWNSNSASTYGWNSGLFPVANVWNFVACVITPNNTTMYLYYVAGSTTNLYKAVSSVPNAAEAFTGGTTWMGGDNWNNSLTLYGCIDEVAIFTNSLSEPQIQDLFLKSLGLPTGIAPAFTTQPANTTVFQGQTLVISSLAGGIPNPTYQWQVTNASGAWQNYGSSPTRITTNETLSVQYYIGNYTTFRSIAKNATGSATSSVAAVTMVPVANWSNWVWTVNFAVATTSHGGPGTPYIGRGILGTNTYWNALGGSQVKNTPISLRDDGVTHSGVNFGSTNGYIGTFSSAGDFSPMNNALLDQFAQINDTNGINFFFTQVPKGIYNVALYGCVGHYVDRGAIFTVYTNGVSAGVQSVTNVQDTLFLPYDNAVVYTNLLVTDGMLQVNVGIVPATPTHTNSTEADFNGAQLELVAAGPDIWSITNSGTNMVLTWAGGGLQQSTNLMPGVGLGWVTNTAVSPYTFAPTGAQRFFRIVNYHFP